MADTHIEKGLDKLWIHDTQGNDLYHIFTRTFLCNQAGQTLFIYFEVAPN